MRASLEHSHDHTSGLRHGWLRGGSAGRRISRFRDQTIHQRRRTATPALTEVVAESYKCYGYSIVRFHRKTLFTPPLNPHLVGLPQYYARWRQWANEGMTERCSIQLRRIPDFSSACCVLYSAISIRPNCAYKLRYFRLQSSLPVDIE